MTRANERSMRVKLVAATAGVLIATTGGAAAQTRGGAGEAGEFDVMIVHGPGGPNMDFVSMPLGVAGETIEGAPYSAEAVTEVVQPLADGNRIVRENRAALYRDGAGRTRREQGLSIVGSLVGSPDERPHVQIHDPVAGTSYVLDMERRIAHKLTPPRLVAFPPTAAAAGVPMATWEAAVPALAGATRTMVFRGSRIASAPEPVVERLGRQSIEGVEVEGTRTTITIPAGQIGNEQPIHIVSERWVSPELKMLVLSRQADPRFGETTYRLTNIVRAEPSPDLFRVPADFTVAEPGSEGLRVGKP